MSLSAPSPAWPDDLTASSLQLVADSTTAVGGFATAAICVVRGDEVVTAAVSGRDRETLLGSRIPVAQLESELVRAEDCGLFRLVEPGRLVAPFRDGDATLRGALTVYDALPSHPTADERESLDRYAARAERAVLTALDRARLAATVRQSEAARQVIREAGQLPSLDQIMRRTAPAMMACFGSASLWWRLTDDTDHPYGEIIWADGRDARPYPPQLAPHIDTAVNRVWQLGDVLIVGPEQMHNVRNPVAARLGIEFCEEQRLASLMIVPLGIGEACLGSMVVSRQAGHPQWTAAEMRTARLLSGDIARALHNTLELQRERALVEELRALDRSRSDLLRTVSHELKNPLAAILGNAELLQEDDLAPDLVDHAVSRIRRGADRMERIVADLTTFSAAGDGLEHERVDLLAVVRDVCDLSGVRAASRGQSLTVEAPEGPLKVYGDAVLLDRVVSNLVDNALKYTPEHGHVAVRLVRLSAERDEEASVELAVQDDGIGISAADRGRLFSEFFRSAEPQAREQPGTGLGLAIVSRIVRRHGGTITVTSQPGSGSTFRVRLPAAT